MSPDNCDLFISYRRRDSAIFSQWLAAQLRAAFGLNSVFIDTRSIRDAEVWPSEIEASLRQAKVTIIVIGKDWLSISDEFGRRLIDLPDDWVRREIEVSLSERKIILPLLIEGAQTFYPEALPTSIRKITEIKVRTIEIDKLEEELTSLVKVIGGLIKRKATSPAIQYPIPGALQIDPLDEQNLQRLIARLPEWRVVSRSTESGDKIELNRIYVFETFYDVIHFMNTASRFINIIDHHPEWTNIWRTLVVYLTTWDIGNKPSMLDVDLAAYLDDLYKRYQKTVTKKDVIDAVR